MVRQLIPEGLGEMVPGPELGVLLAGIDIHALTGADAVEVLRARARQLSHDQARLLAVMVEVGLCDPGAGAGEVARLPEPPQYAADEIRAALAWTRGAADRELGFAETLVVRMPAVFTALESGMICRAKAWVFADLCADLTAEQIEVVCARLLPKAGRLTTGELAARIKRLAIALDPEWAARRYAAAVRERTVIGYLNPDGTATVTGSALPVDAAAAACAHVEELARAAKRAGHPGRIGPLRADIYLGLLDGRWQHCNREQIITELLTRAASDTGDGADPADPPDSGGIPAGTAPAPSTSPGGTPAHHAATGGGDCGGGDCGGGDCGGGDCGGGDCGGGDCGGGDCGGGDCGGGDCGGGDCGGGDCGGGDCGGGDCGGGDCARTPRDAGPAVGEPGPVSEGAMSEGPVSEGAVSEGAVSEGAVSEGAVSEGAVSEGAVSEGAVSEGAVQLVRRVGVELRVGFSTLLGLDRHPGEIAGWGPITAEVARSVVVSQRGAQWRYALTDPAGQLLLAGITRRRPHSAAPGGGAGELPVCRGGIVELQLPAALLTELAADVDGCGEWAAVVADIAAQYLRYTQGGGPAAQDPAARFAGAVLHRHVQIRDRSCVYPGCRCTARSADLDHTVDHTQGGVTTEGNSGPLCRHDHRLKHTGRWRLHQPEPGHFTWISPLGRAYRTQPPPITHDQPEPRPRPSHPGYPPSATHDDDGQILDRPPPQPDPPPPDRPPDPDEPPPF